MDFLDIHHVLRISVQNCCLSPETQESKLTPSSILNDEHIG